MDHYIYKSKNKAGQTIVCEIWRTLDNTLNFSFYITTKRKRGFQEGHITGKDGLSSLLWAKECLLDFIEFGKTKFKGSVLEVLPDDPRKRKVYERCLLPLGFTFSKDKNRSLIYTL